MSPPSLIVLLSSSFLPPRPFPPLSLHPPRRVVGRVVFVAAFSPLAGFFFFPFLFVMFPFFALGRKNNKDGIIRLAWISPPPFFWSSPDVCALFTSMFKNKSLCFCLIFLASFPHPPSNFFPSFISDYPRPPLKSVEDDRSFPLPLLASALFLRLLFGLPPLGAVFVLFLVFLSSAFVADPFPWATDPPPGPLSLSGVNGRLRQLHLDRY